MNIIAVGEAASYRELVEKFGEGHQYFHFTSAHDARRHLEDADALFDFIIDEDPTQVEYYKDKKKPVIFLNTVKTTLAEICTPVEGDITATVVGFNGLPTFVNREMLEVSLHRESDKDRAVEFCKNLKSSFSIVKDQVGFVTPRIICMIINEAYLTAQDGTASRADIDLAMKLGTNYPFGPFEWTLRIGIKHVYEVLEALYRVTKDERYRVSDLLTSEYKAKMTR